MAYFRVLLNFSLKVWRDMLIKSLSRAFVLKQLVSLLKTWAERMGWRKKVLPTIVDQPSRRNPAIVRNSIIENRDDPQSSGTKSQAGPSRFSYCPKSDHREDPQNAAELQEGSLQRRVEIWIWHPYNLNAFQHVLCSSTIAGTYLCFSSIVIFFSLPKCFHE